MTVTPLPARPLGFTAHAWTTPSVLGSARARAQTQSAMGFGQAGAHTAAEGVEGPVRTRGRFFRCVHLDKTRCCRREFGPNNRPGWGRVSGKFSAWILASRKMRVQARSPPSASGLHSARSRSTDSTIQSRTGMTLTDKTSRIVVLEGSRPLRERLGLAGQPRRSGSADNGPGAFLCCSRFGRLGRITCFSTGDLLGRCPRAGAG
jgi:hypothetical protein